MARVAERLLARARARRDPGLVPEARPAPAGAEPGDVHRRARQRDHDRDLLPRARPRARRPALVRRHDRDLALADRAVRELRRGDRRGPRQGPGERAARDAHDDDRAPAQRRRRASRTCPAPELQQGDVVVVSAGEIIPADGEIIEGVGSVDESAITGESAPVIRESGGDRSAVTGGTRLLSDQLVDPRHAGAGQVVPRPDDRARRGRGAAQDARTRSRSTSCSPA